MNPLFTFLLILITYCVAVISKYFFIIGYSDGIEKVSFNKRKQLFIFLLTPFIYLLNITIFKDKKIKILIFLSEILGLLTGFAISFFSYKILIDKSYLFSDKLFNIIFFLSLTTALLYLAIYDLINFAIPIEFTKKLLFSIVLINAIVGLIRFITTHNSTKILFQNTHLGFIDNLLSGIFISLIIWLIIKVTKDKGLGTGDIDVMQIVGFSLGAPSIIVVFLTTLISGSIISIFYAILIKKYKDVLVPFVPFILIGFLITINYGNPIWEFLKFGSIF